MPGLAARIDGSSAVLVLKPVRMREGMGEGLRRRIEGAWGIDTICVLLLFARQRSETGAKVND